jgi:hypothetical protein
MNNCHDISKIGVRKWVCTFEICLVRIKNVYTLKLLRYFSKPMEFTLKLFYPNYMSISYINPMIPIG